MIVVVHYQSKDPDIYYSVTDKDETRILNKLTKDWAIQRSSAEDWPGQDNPRYAVHHYDAKKRKKGNEA